MFKQVSIKLILYSVVLFLVACTNIFPESEEKGMEHRTTNESHIEKEVTMELPGVSLQKGDQREDVQQLQRILNHLGYDLTETGIYDEKTTWAITDFQLQFDSLITTGIYDEDTREMLQKVMDEKEMIEPGSQLAKFSTAEQREDVTIVENPYEILALINKSHALPEDFYPKDLVIPDVRFPFTEDDPKKQLRQVAAEALEQLFAASDEAGLELFAISGFRSYERQDAIFAANVEQHGEEEANTFSARPGESEHQSGLTMDVSSPNVNFELTTQFGETKEGKWLQKHAMEYGFIIRYPEGKEAITQYQYEPWHLRYVGEKAAKKIMEQGLTLEEYLETLK